MGGSFSCGTHKAYRSGSLPDTEPWQPAKQVIGWWLWRCVVRTRIAVLQFCWVVWTRSFIVGWEGADKALRGWGCEKQKPLTPTEPE